MAPKDVFVKPFFFSKKTKAMFKGGQNIKYVSNI